MVQCFLVNKFLSFKESLVVKKSTLAFLGGSGVKNLPVNAGDASLIPGSARSHEEGNGTHSSIRA